MRVIQGEDALDYLWITWQLEAWRAATAPQVVTSLGERWRWFRADQSQIPGSLTEK